MLLLLCAEERKCRVAERIDRSIWIKRKGMTKSAVTMRHGQSPRAPSVRVAETDEQETAVNGQPRVWRIPRARSRNLSVGAFLPIRGPGRERDSSPCSYWENKKTNEFCGSEWLQWYRSLLILLTYFHRQIYIIFKFKFRRTSFATLTPFIYNHVIINIAIRKFLNFAQIKLIYYE